MRVQNLVNFVNFVNLASCASVCLAVACGGGGAASVSSGPMPENGTFNGVYQSPQYGTMNFVQNGSAVVGEYKTLDMRSGKIQGEAQGDLLRFEWVERKAMVSNRPQETRGHGYFKYEIDKGNGDHILKGEWGMGENETGGGQWNAYKMKGKEPHMSNDSESSGGDSSDSSDDSKPASSDDQSKDDDLF